MSDDRIDEIICERARLQREAEEKATRRKARDLANARFEEAWRSAYADLDPSFDDNLIQKTSKRLVLLGSAIKERF